MTSNQEGIAEGHLSACEQENRELRAEVERLRALETIVREHIGHRELAYHLQEWLSRNWQGSQTSAKVERLRAALEEIADVAHPADMRSVNIARRALGRT